MLTEEDFAFLNSNESHNSMGTGKKQWAIPSDLTLEEINNQAIVATLQRTHGNIKEAASILGVDRSTLYDRIKKYNLPRG